jgi:hypothetical protein
MQYREDSYNRLRLTVLFWTVEEHLYEACHCDFGTISEDVDKCGK